MKKLDLENAVAQAATYPCTLCARCSSLHLPLMVSLAYDEE